ncbi:hypothetical protein GCM10009809_31120 [Isoptericola hypogeus]|uniref:Uncharacterized protein n=1 Tax=Isoptericola hypogeus TaxID=300179 RepID=A0ABN2JP36_9MICO
MPCGTYRPSRSPSGIGRLVAFEVSASYLLLADGPEYQELELVEVVQRGSSAAVAAGAVATS